MPIFGDNEVILRHDGCKFLTAHIDNIFRVRAQMPSGGVYYAAFTDSVLAGQHYDSLCL